MTKTKLHPRGEWKGWYLTIFSGGGGAGLLLDVVLEERENGLS
jgi:hypothetical protein